MIDNFQKAIALALEMQKEVPFDAHPTKQIAKHLKEKFPHFDINAKIKIENVAYVGDEGGIVCNGYIESMEEVLSVSLTHLMIDEKSPFYKAAKTYQENRVKKLSRQHRRF
jgi:hypothetical protein